MALEAIKCPQCGANIEVNASAPTFFCTYCGTKLQASRSSQGVLSASILSGIKDDTSIVAKRAALERLNEQLSQLLGQRHTQKAALQTEYDIKMGDLYLEASAKAGLFRNTLKTKYYIEGEAILRNHVRDVLLELDTRIKVIEQRIDTLNDEVDYLVMHV